METTPRARPVPPLTDEQKAELKQLAEGATPGPWRSAWDDEADPADLNEVVVETVAPQEKPYGSVVVGLLWYDGPHAACTRENSAYIAAANPAATLSLLAENARLSRLLEEERRTVAELREQVILWVPISQGYPDQFEVCLLAGNLGPDMLHGINTLKRTYRHNPELRVWELHGRAERQVPESAVHYYACLPESPSEPAPAAPCQRDCQKCEKGEAAVKAAKVHLYTALGVRLTPYNEVERNRYEGFLAGYSAKRAAPTSGVGLQGEEGGGRG